MTPVRLEPATPRSRVKHSTTEPLRSPPPPPPPLKKKMKLANGQWLQFQCKTLIWKQGQADTCYSG